MFARSVVKLSSRVSRHHHGKALAPLTVKPSSSKAPFVTTTKLNDTPEIIPAKEISSTTYTDGQVEESTIVLDHDVSTSNGVGTVSNALSKTLHKKLPTAMQRLSLIDKVVMVTGYVLQN